MLFAEDDLEDIIDLIAGKPAQRSSVSHLLTLPSGGEEGRAKRVAEDGKTMSFDSVMKDMSGLCRFVVLPKIAVDKAPEVIMFEQISDTQKRAFKLLNVKI